MRRHPCPHTICGVIHRGQRISTQTFVHQSGCKSVACAYCVFYCYAEYRMLVRTPLIDQHTSISSTSHTDQLQIEFIENLSAKRDFSGRVDVQETRQHRELFVIELNNVCPVQRRADYFGRVEGLSQVYVEDSQGLCPSQFEKFANSATRGRRTLSKRSKANCIRRLRQPFPAFVPLEKIPGRRMHDLEFRLALWIDLNPHRACPVHRVGLHEFVGDPKAK